jgi:SAM-dependent methyltransferase
MSGHTPEDLQRIYGTRFAANRDYRDQVWQILVKDFFQQFVQTSDRVLDLGCGYGEFTKHIRCAAKFAMDLNPDAPRLLGDEVTCFNQDCSARWPLPDHALEVVFTSNFFEHLPDKPALGRTLDEVFRCLSPGGRLIAMGPNIRFLSGSYWDFWDHYVPLSEKSLSEALVIRNFELTRVEDRFLPYTMSDGRHHPLAFLRLYLRLRPAWKILGRQFLIVATKPAAPPGAAAL